MRSTIILVFQIRVYIHSFLCKKNIHTHIHIYIQAYKHACMHACIHSYIQHTYIHTYIHTYVHTYIHVCACRCICVFVSLSFHVRALVYLCVRKVHEASVCKPDVKSGMFDDLAATTCAAMRAGNSPPTGTPADPGVPQSYHSHYANLQSLFAVNRVDSNRRRDASNRVRRGKRESAYQRGIAYIE